MPLLSALCHEDNLCLHLFPATMALLLFLLCLQRQLPESIPYKIALSWTLALIYMCATTWTAFRLFSCCPLTIFFVTGHGPVWISCYGTVTITLSNHGQIFTFQLLKTANIPTFHTNVVSLQHLMAKNVHLKTELSDIYFCNAPFADVTERHNWFVLEYNLQCVFAASSCLPRALSIASTFF